MEDTYTTTDAQVQEIIETQRNLNDLYWLDVIAQLADMQAATAEYAASVRGTSKRERERQARICCLNLQVLEEKQLSKRSRSPEDVMKRLRDIIKILEDQV